MGRLAGWHGARKLVSIPTGFGRGGDSNEFAVIRLVGASMSPLESARLQHFLLSFTSGSRGGLVTERLLEVDSYFFDHF